MTKPIIGLLGGIGSGKSTVAAAFTRRGGRLIVADTLGHEALRQPDIRDRIVQRWGRGVLDATGEVARRALGKIVFADGEERKALEGLTFPWIEWRCREEIAKADADPEASFVVLDAAVMLEAGWNNVCSRLVYIDVPRGDRLARLAAQRGWDAKEVEAREAAQWPLADKAARADAVLDNSGPPEAMEGQVEELLRRWKIPYRPEPDKMR